MHFLSCMEIKTVIIIIIIKASKKEGRLQKSIEGHRLW